MKKLTILLAKIAYGLILPLYLFWFVFFSHFQYQRDEQIQDFRSKMEESLELLVNFHPDDKFFHALLQKNFALADAHEKPQTALENRIRALKKAFPGSLKFIVWSSTGKVNQRLTEEKSFQYVLKSMFVVCREILQHYRTEVLPDAKNLPGVQKRINLLRGYFGQFLLPDLMIEFFRPSYTGRAITVSEAVDKRKLWVYAGKNYSVAVFISAEVLNQRIGPRLLVRDFNQKNSPVKLGYFTTLDYFHAGLPKNSQVVNRLKLEARKFEENAVSFRQIDDFLLLLRQVSPELIVLAYVEKLDRIIVPEASASAALAELIKWLLVILFIGCCLSLKTNSLQLSVQKKILLLMFFANGLPALILVSTGYEYFSAKKAAIIEAQQQESLRILKEIDVRFPAIRKGFARQLNAFINEKNLQFGAEKWPQNEISSLEKFCRGFDPSVVMLLDRKDEELIKFNKDDSGGGKAFFKDFLTRSLEFASNNDLRRRGEAGGSTLESMASEDLIYLDFARFLDKINLQHTGDEANWTFIKLLGDFRNFNSWGIFSAVWARGDMLRTFVQREFSQIEAEIFPRRLALMEINSKIILPEAFNRHSQMQRLLHKAVLRRQLFREDFKIAGQNFLFTAVVGDEMPEAVLVMLFPRQLVEQQVNSFKTALFVIGLIILLVLLQIVKIFSDRLLQPVRHLETGIEHLQQRDFRYRISGSREDELGQLISAFNSSMEGLEELAVGTAVQESLLPEANFNSGKISLFARSLFMTKMGGDYFDYFEYQPGRIGIIFGDVAGHGIPAAVIMAMAKAVVASNYLRFKKPDEMLQQANEVLLHLKERKLRRMMTCQCLDLDCRTGEFSLANAGHCYPVHIKGRGKDLEFIELGGMPLGNRTRKPFEVLSLKLLPGDILVLYTDGIVEAANNNGEMFDYHRFFALLKESYDENLETFWSRIIEGNRKWAPQQDDDLTFMLIRCGE